jgi:hypothetical protein
MLSQLSYALEKDTGNPEQRDSSQRSEETLVFDSRAALRPAQLVEQKLATVLKAVPASQVRMPALLRARFVESPVRVGGS